MKIFYTASYYGKQQYQRQFDKVLAEIEKHDVDIISPEIGGYQKVLSNKEMIKLKTADSIHYMSIQRGIQLCDATIIEISHQDFQLGHEASLAIQNKKPVLCLSIHEDFSKKIRNPYFFGAKYNDFNIDEIISNFLRKASNEKLSERFNMFLSPTQLVYLEKQSERSNMSKSEYLRDLLIQDMR